MWICNCIKPDIRSIDTQDANIFKILGFTGADPGGGPGARAPPDHQK